MAGDLRVLVLPITHTPPADKRVAIELPTPTKVRLGLDSERSWIVLSELNVFTWPGPDLRPLTSGEPDSVIFGMLPPGLFRVVRDRFIALNAERRVAQVRRTT